MFIIFHQTKIFQQYLPLKKQKTCSIIAIPQWQSPIFHTCISKSKWDMLTLFNFFLRVFSFSNLSYTWTTKSQSCHRRISSNIPAVDWDKAEVGVFFESFIDVEPGRRMIYQNIAYTNRRRQFYWEISSIKSWIKNIQYLKDFLNG